VPAVTDHHRDLSLGRRGVDVDLAPRARVLEHIGQGLAGSMRNGLADICRGLGQEAESPAGRQAGFGESVPDVAQQGRETGPRPGSALDDQAAGPGCFPGRQRGPRPGGPRPVGHRVDDRPWISR